MTFLQSRQQTVNVSVWLSYHTVIHQVIHPHNMRSSLRLSQDSYYEPYLICEETQILKTKICQGVWVTEPVKAQLLISAQAMISGS